MRTNKKISVKRPHKYDIMSHNKRMTFIKMVTKEGFSVYRAAKVLAINNSTAKAIIRNYKKSGHVCLRKERQNSPINQVQQSPQIQNKEQTQRIITMTNIYPDPIQEHMESYYFFPTEDLQICYFMQNFYATPFWTY